MVQFYSEHNIAQSRYEQACREARATDTNRQANYRQSIEDSLVKGGLKAIEDYEALLKLRHAGARCLAEYDGVNMGYAIAARARKRLEEVKE